MLDRVPMDILDRLLVAPFIADRVVPKNDFAGVCFAASLAAGRRSNTCLQACATELGNDGLDNPSTGSEILIVLR